uniref:Glycosyltransferase n=1 Tax=Salix viminalis TaxID=40686 RepID=A0A6N2LW59_SALVM
MGGEENQVHIFFFPFMAHGHLIPTIDMAKLFASRGVKATIVTTPVNAPLVSRTIQRSKSFGFDINIKTIKFPAVEVGLPEGFENAESITSHELEGEMTKKFLQATAMLQEPLEKLLQEGRPDCLIADMFLPWTTDAAAKFGIPRLVFHGFSCFSLCTSDCLTRYKPFKEVSSDSELFVVPELPGEIKLTRKQLPDFMKQNVETEFTRLIQKVRESSWKSYGIVINSFYELESAYADFFKELGRKAWNIGPVSLCNREFEEKAHRGKEASIDEHECLKWLDSKEPNSVVYICFGTVANFSDSQLKEIAIALEASGQQFIWVVRKDKKARDKEEWLPEGFEKRMESKGLIIRGWAPQVMILDHESIGGFVTHCGWNSTVEGIAAGKPMVTWPVSAEQFFNEKLVTDVLKIGVAVGVQQWVTVSGDKIKSEAVEKAVTRIMIGEEAEEMRSRVEALGGMAKRAIEEDGSSYSNLNALLSKN